MLKRSIEGTKAMKLSQKTNGKSADTAMRCPRTKKLRQRRVDQTFQNCIKKAAREKQSLTESRRTNHQKPRFVMGNSISEVEKSVYVVTPILEERGNVSDKTIQIDNRTTVSSKESNEERLIPLAV